MANFQSTQALYSLTLQKPSATDVAVTCNIIPGLKASDQQIFEARGERLYLIRLRMNEDRSEVSLETVVEHHTFSNVRGLCAFRIPGTQTDALIVTSDSGRVALLNYDANRNVFKVVKIETYGKSGVRRGIPGHYLVNDRRGRAFMIASPEKSKVVYMMQKQIDGTIQMSSPHEINQWSVLTYDICALDTGWEHPIFAALEVDMSESDSDSSGVAYEQREKRLVYYTVDLSLNHVVKSWSTRVLDSANKVFGVPGGTDGPSGALVCSEGMIEYVHQGSHERQEKRLRACIPRRRRRIEDPDRACFIVSGCLHMLKGRHDFFFLLQTEDGDIFKLTMTMATDAQGRRTATPIDMTLRYYETLPVARSMVIIRKGYVYLTAENGDSRLYFVHDLAENEEVETYNSFSVSADKMPWYFTPRELKYMELATEAPSLHPLIKTRVDNPLNEDSPQIYALQGSRNNSSLKVIRHGLDLEEFVSSPLGGVLYHKAWSLKPSADADHHKYLILSSDRGENGPRTAVLQIEETVESTDETAFILTNATVFAGQVGDSNHIQIHPRGIRNIFSSGAFNDWESPMSVVAAAANQWQILIGLSSNELVFFLLSQDGHLQQLQDMAEMTGRITAIAVGTTPKGSYEAKYAVVGCDDCTIRVLSIDAASPFDLKSIQALSSAPTSIQMIDQLDPTSNTMATYVHIGLQSGLYLRALLDENGELGEVRTKLLSAEPIRLCQVQTHEQNTVVACTSRPWLGYDHPNSNQYTLTPIIASRWESATSFLSEEIQGICAISGRHLLIDTHLSTSSTKLKYTPRAFARHPYNSLSYVIQSDANTPSSDTLTQTLSRFNAHATTSDPEKSNFYTFPEEEDSMAGMEGNDWLGLPKFAGHWASCIQAVDVAEGVVADTFEFDNNDAALSAVCVPFQSREWEVFIAVGVGRNLDQNSAQSATGAIHIFSLESDGRTMKHLHTTEFNSPIYALHPYKGRLAVGVGPELFIYDLGLKALLRKTRGLVVQNQIVSIDSVGHRLSVADVSESVTFVVFKEEFNRLVPFVDDSIQRWTTNTTMLDYEAVAGGDKFGNLWIVRCPEQASKESDEDSANGHLMNERHYMGGAPYRSEVTAHFYAHDIPMSLQRTSLVPGGDKVLFWSGLQGTLGLLQPFVSRADLEFFLTLEAQMRAEDSFLTGRDHLMYRGYYVPVKGVVDGDLCERFMGLAYEVKQKIAAECEREVKEIEKKLQDMRSRVAF